MAFGVFVIEFSSSEIILRKGETDKSTNLLPEVLEQWDETKHACHEFFHRTKSIEHGNTWPAGRPALVTAGQVRGATPLALILKLFELTNRPLDYAIGRLAVISTLIICVLFPFCQSHHRFEVSTCELKRLAENRP